MFGHTSRHRLGHFVVSNFCNAPFFNVIFGKYYWRLHRNDKYQPWSDGVLHLILEVWQLLKGENDGNKVI
jgi:hypothetical protein